MVALAAALGDLHVAQQGVHFRQRQASIGTDRSVAGHGPEQFVQMRLDTVAGAVLQQVGDDVAYQLGRLRLLEQRRDLSDRQGFRAQSLQLEAQTLEPAGVLLGAIRLALADRDRLRHQQRLTTQAFAGHRHLEALVGDPLVGRVHVHQHQAVGVLGEDVDALELRQGVTQRGDVLGAFGQRGRRLAGGQRREVGLVGAAGLGQRGRRLRPGVGGIAGGSAGRGCTAAPTHPRRRALQHTFGQAHLALRAEFAGGGTGRTRLDQAGRPRRRGWSSGRTSPSARCRVP